MSAERDELRRLIEAMPEEQVPVVLAQFRHTVRPAPEGTWPPEFFGIAKGRHTDAARRADELLAEGFGRAR